MASLRTKVPLPTRPGSVEGSPVFAITSEGNPLRLTRNAVAAGITALSLAAVPAAPAFAKNGGDAVGDAGSTGVVTFISPDLVLPTNVKPNNSGKDRCKAWLAVGIDPITGSTIMQCMGTGA